MLTVVTPPISSGLVLNLRAGERLELGGDLLLASRAACKRLVQDLRAGRALPVDLAGQVLVLDEVLDAATDVEHRRVDDLLVPLLAQRLRGVVGRGSRSAAVRYAFRKYTAVGLTPFGNGTFVGSIQEQRVVGYPELGEAVALARARVRDFGVIVVEDSFGGVWSEVDLAV